MTKVNRTFYACSICSQEPGFIARRYTPFNMASILAQLYEKFGERQLQQNIRGSVGDKGTNAAILDSCTTNKATNFYHFNNGITFLCEEAKCDNFTSSLTLVRAQVVNGGQTLRVLHK